MNTQLYAITISHQLGSGGALLGEKLSARLDIPFLDRDILKEVAHQLNLAESEAALREERLSTFWQSFAQAATFANPTMVITADHFIPTDQEIFDQECETIRRIAENHSAIFLGRCGRYILRQHPRQIKLFVHASRSSRVKRLQDLYHQTISETEKLIDTNDRERGAYIRSFAHENWLDTRLYDLTLDTSSLGLDLAVELALKCVEAKLG